MKMLIGNMPPVAISLEGSVGGKLGMRARLVANLADVSLRGFGNGRALAARLGHAGPLTGANAVEYPDSGKFAAASMIFGDKGLLGARVRFIGRTDGQSPGYFDGEE